MSSRNVSRRMAQAPQLRCAETFNNVEISLPKPRKHMLEHRQQKTRRCRLWDTSPGKDPAPDPGAHPPTETKTNHADSIISFNLFAGVSGRTRRSSCPTRRRAACTRAWRSAQGRGDAGQLLSAPTVRTQEQGIGKTDTLVLTEYMHTSGHSMSAATAHTARLRSAVASCPSPATLASPAAVRAPPETKPLQ